MRQVKERAVRNVIVAAVDDYLRTRTPYHGTIWEVQAMGAEAKWTIEQARKHVDDLDWGPVQYLKEELAATAAVVHWVRELITRAMPHEIAESFWTYRSSTEAQGYAKRTFTEGEVNAAYLGVYYDIYLRERNHLLNVIRTAHQCGIEERLTRLEESKAELVGQALLQFATLAGLDVTDTSVRQWAQESLMAASRKLHTREITPGTSTGEDPGV